MADHTDQMISIRGCRIRLMRGGSGPPLLFLHGGGGAGIWLPSMAALAKKFDVLAPEHPGFGASDTPRMARQRRRPRQLLSRLSRTARPARRPPRRQFARRLDRGRACGAQHQPARVADARSARPASMSTACQQVDTFLCNDEQRIRDLFYDQDLAEAVIASSERPEFEDANLKNRTASAQAAVAAAQPRSRTCASGCTASTCRRCSCGATTTSSCRANMRSRSSN